MRLLYECHALAFIAEQAGGYASDGINRTMEEIPTDIHQQVPFFAGSKEMVAEAEKMMRQEIL